MKILLISATKFEIATLLGNFKKIRSPLKDGPMVYGLRTPGRRVRPTWRTGKNLSNFRFGKHTIDVLVTGVGMTATAFYLGKILNRNYDFAINAGVAGSFRKNILPGEAVNVVSDCFADLGVQHGKKFMTAEEIGLAKVSALRATHPEKYVKRLSPAISKLLKVKAITVNTVHGNEDSIKKVVKKFHPDIETMEGAAFFLACAHYKIPCIQIRAVSNYVERRNKKKWKMNLAAENLCITIENILHNL